MLSKLIFNTRWFKEKILLLIEIKNRALEYEKSVNENLQ